MEGKAHTNTELIGSNIQKMFSSLFQKPHSKFSLAKFQNTKLIKFVEKNWYSASAPLKKIFLEVFLKVRRPKVFFETEK